MKILIRECPEYKPAQGLYELDRLRALASVIIAVDHNFTQYAEQGMTLRY